MTSTYRASLLSSRKLVRAFLKYRLAGSKPLKMIIKWLVYVSLLLVLSLVFREVFKFRARASPVFPSPQKPTFSYSNSTRNDLGEEPLRGCATFISLFFSWLVHFNASLTIYLLSGPNVFREPANSSRHILLCDLQGCAPRCRIEAKLEGLFVLVIRNLMSSAIWAPTSRVFPEACSYGKPAPFDQSTSMTFRSLRFSSASFIWILKALVLPF